MWADLVARCRLARAALERLAHRCGLDRLAYRVSRLGPRGLLRLYRHHEFDRRHGVETRGYSDPRYEPTPAESFERVMAALSIRHQDFVFVDVGSGKGKVLLLASRFPFRKVIGVERGEDLHRIAVANLGRFRAEERRCSEVESICIDAYDYQPPPSPAVFYLFNPFGEPVLRRVLANVKRSLEAHPREIYVIFYAPVRRGSPWDRRRVFEEAGFLACIRDDGEHAIYANRESPHFVQSAIRTSGSAASPSGTGE